MADQCRPDECACVNRIEDGQRPAPPKNSISVDIPRVGNTMNSCCTNDPARPYLPAELSPWTDNRAGIGFGVLIESISQTEITLAKNGRITTGLQYLLEIPRPGFKA